MVAFVPAHRTVPLTRKAKPLGSFAFIMSSRSTRPSAAKDNSGSIPDEHDSNDEYDPGTKQMAKKPRRKPGGTSKQHPEWKGVKGVRGKLRMLTEMPLDILFEVGLQFMRHSQGSPADAAQIFSHLHPWDVLRLARTTKSLRDILMRRSSISIWKNALMNTPGMPECPNDMTEPEFINLAYDKHCFVSTLA